MGFMMRRAFVSGETVTAKTTALIRTRFCSMIKTGK